MTLGEKIRQTRLEKGLTQREVVGERITRNMLSQIENDLATPSVGTLEYLAAVLGVNVGWLMAEESGSASSLLTHARSLLRRGEWAECAQILQAHAEQPDDEMKLIAATAMLRRAEALLDEEKFSEAEKSAQQALKWNENGLYEQAEFAVRAAAVIARCAMQESGGGAQIEQYRQIYLERQLSPQHHLLMARYNLKQEHIQAAEREIWLIVDLPEKYRAEYLILRGQLAIRKEQYDSAAQYLHQAEQAENISRLLRRELLKTLEICYRETGDYKMAYEYASAQLALDKA